MSFVREDLTYFVMPRRKFHPRELSLLKQRVGDWLLKKTDIFAALLVTGTQWHHTMYFLLLAYPLFLKAFTNIVQRFSS